MAKLWLTIALTQCLLDEGPLMGWPRTMRPLSSQVLHRSSDGRPHKQTWCFSPQFTICPRGHVISIDIPSSLRSPGSTVSTKFPSGR